MPNPVDVKRGEYLQRGTLPLILLAAPLGRHWRQTLRSWPSSRPPRCCGDRSPWPITPNPSLSARANAAASAKTPDSWIRVATFPWHLVKALLLAIPRILLLVIIYMSGTAVATAALALPVHTISWYFTADWGIPVPLLNDVPFSASGLALGGFMAIGWLVTVFAPQSMMIRLGGGVLRGLKHSRPAGAPSTEVGGAPPAPVAPAPKAAARHRAVHHMGHHHRGLVRDADSGHADQLDAVRLERAESHTSAIRTHGRCVSDTFVPSHFLQGIHLRSALGAVLLRPGHYDGAQTLKRLQGDSYVRSEAPSQACHTR